MGQTVSLNSCVSGGSFIRVMRTDGEFDQFDFPCVAAEVMVQHPGHLVVHCSPVDKSTIGQRTKITIMLPDQPMLPGQPYMLYPIPDHYKKSLSRSKSFSMLKKKFESNTTPAISPAEKRQGRRKSLKMLFTRLHLATYVASNMNASDEDATPLKQPSDAPPHTAEEQEFEGDEENEKTSMTVQIPHPATLNFAWRPFLSTIPESPLGFHSTPQSPLGLYKMDGVLSHSPLSVGSRPLPTYVAASS